MEISSGRLAKRERKLSVNINFRVWFMTPQLKRLCCPFLLCIEWVPLFVLCATDRVFQAGAGFSYYSPLNCILFGFGSLDQFKYINIIKRIDVVYQFHYTKKNRTMVNIWFLLGWCLHFTNVYLMIIFKEDIDYLVVIRLFVDFFYLCKISNHIQIFELVAS